MSAREISLIIPYYDNPLMLLRQYQHLASLATPLASNIHLIIVDDGSPDTPAYPPPAPLSVASVEIYRILVDVRWNWIAARNLAMSKTETEWALMTDIDHLVSREAFARIIKSDMDSETVYRFTRVLAPRFSQCNPHPNSWFLTRRMFEKIGGYDERFSGYYGSDGEFRDRVNLAAKRVVILDEPLIVHTHEIVADAVTTRYLRKQPEDYVGVANVKRLIKESPIPHRLTFPWEKVYSVGIG